VITLITLINVLLINTKHVCNFYKLLKIDLEPDQIDTKRFLDIVKNCKYDPKGLSGLYSRMCQDIHGASWHGPGVLARLSKFNSEPERCLMRCIIKDMHLEISDE